jgi:hypothetical protein
MFSREEMNVILSNPELRKLYDALILDAFKKKREQALVQAARAVFTHCHISGPASQLKDLANALAKYEGEY